jgi:hypothetical protein
MEKSTVIHDPDDVSRMVDTATPDLEMPPTVPDHHKDFAAQIAAMTPAEYKAAERALLWKIDKNLIPWMT